MAGGPIIAVVDDDAAIRTALSRLLRSLDYRVRLFASAEAFLADGDEVDCLVTDVQMPGMNGLELQRAVRRSRPELPVIIITAFPEAAIREQAVAAGARHFLSKPFAAETIAQCLREATGHAG
ncbi:response regulator [Roseomonas frigidaquae]|uniref:Response regulator n=1 Tax=Falsiroseomonas frigidaquae TaxID=487318 RepID=A0ABX1F4C0_9PROT|nr:response regulator [Falsiroseomonas frigidaquae]